VTGFPQLRVEHDGICRGCVLGTNANVFFSSSDNRSKGILDFVHSYLCGPMTVASLSGSGLMDETMVVTCDGLVTVTGWTLQDIWVSYLHSRTQGEKDEVRPQSGRVHLLGTVNCRRNIKSTSQVREIEVCMDVSFEKEVAFRRSRGSHMQIDSET
jgi:hypothetical protein